MTYSVNHNQLDWLNFDSEQMKLSGRPTLTGDFELTFTASDKHSNKTEHKVIVTIKK